MTEHLAKPSAWTGPLTLDLRNDRGWSPGTLEVNVRLDTLDVRFQGRMIAGMDRARFGTWMKGPKRDRYVADDTRWALKGSGVVLTLKPGGYEYRVSPESLDTLAEVI